MHSARISDDLSVRNSSQKDGQKANGKVCLLSSYSTLIYFHSRAKLTGSSNKARHEKDSKVNAESVEYVNIIYLRIFASITCRSAVHTVKLGESSATKRKKPEHGSSSPISWAQSDDEPSRYVNAETLWSITGHF